MKYILFLLFIVGCKKDVYPYHIKNIEAACKDHGGWSVLYMTGGRCADGFYITNLMVEQK